MSNILYRKIVRILSDNGVEDSEFEAKVIISHYSDFFLSDCVFKYEYDFSDESIKNINSTIERRLNGEPLQYILGEWDFMDFTFKVGEGVLIPRPETELLCEYVVDKIKNMEHPIVYDLCSGSGCIGLSIKKYVPQCEIYLVEKNEKALEYLCYNASEICKDTFLTIVKGDIFDLKSFVNHPKADAIVSNPPYIRTDEISSLQKEVLFEPESALDGGADGLDFYRCLTSEWKNMLKKDGFMAFECGEDQGNDISCLFRENGFDSEIIKDYNNLDRIVAGRRKK